MSQYLFEIANSQSGPEPTTVRPNVWLLSSEEIPPMLFTAEQAAKFLNVGRHRIFDLIRNGELRSVKVGSSRRISARALADYVASLEVLHG